MDYKRNGNFIFLRLDKDEEVVSVLKKLAVKEKIETAVLQGLGAVYKVKLAYYSLIKQVYITSKLKGEFEMISLIGNISYIDKKPVIHAHINLIDNSAASFGGHLIKARVWATAEIFIQILPIKTCRFKDKKTGLNLIQFK
jgi:predicted DNA-binding protein with PD1-like motif